jgi:hypothetical protein
LTPKTLIQILKRSILLADEKDDNPHTHTKHDLGRRDEFLPQRFERRASPEEQCTTTTTTTRTALNEWMNRWMDEGMKERTIQ